MAEGFNAFWIMYPRKVAKKAAEKAYTKALKLYPHTAIIASLGIFLETEWRGREIDKVPHAASWLNRESFEEVEERPEILEDDLPLLQRPAFHLHWCNSPTCGFGHDWQCTFDPCIYPGHMWCARVKAKEAAIRG